MLLIVNLHQHLLCCCCFLFFCVKLFEVRASCSFCWYWWNCWPSLFKLLFIIDIVVNCSSFTRRDIRSLYIYVIRYTVLTKLLVGLLFSFLTINIVQFLWYCTCVFFVSFYVYITVLCARVVFPPIKCIYIYYETA